MKSLTLALAAGAALVAADNGNTWSSWSAPQSPSSAPAAGWTDWVTTVQYVPTTIYDKITEYVTVPGPTITETETETETDTITITQVVSSLQTQTVPQVQTVATTVVNSAVVTATVNNAVTVTSDNVITETVSVSYCTSQALTGLVTCPSRIINPTYTPPTPLPSDYLWGCPPGQLCHPKRENCNFEQNLPADTYVCAPEECLPVAELPPIDTYLNYEDINGTCAWLTPADDYFNIDPLFFGLNFGIFNIYGQPTCTPVAPASTVTVQVTGQPMVVSTTVTVEVSGSPIVVPTTVTVQVTGQPAEIATTVVVPTTIVIATTVTVQVSGSPVVVPTTVTAVISASSSWQSWQGPASAPSSANWKGTSAPPQVTKRAELANRDIEERALVVASQCYAVCDYAAYVYQSMGKVPALCSPDSPWSTAYRRVISCTSTYSATGVSSVASQLYAPITYCRTHTARSLFGRRVFG